MQHAKEQPTPTMPGAMPFSKAHSYRAIPRCCSGTALRREPEALLGSAPALGCRPPDVDCILGRKGTPVPKFPPTFHRSDHTDHTDHVSRKPYTL